MSTLSSRIHSTIRSLLHARRQTATTWRSLVCASSLLLSTPVLAIADTPVEFKIEAQPLQLALKDFSTQAKMQILYRSEVVEGVTGTAVVGTFEKGAALQKLLEGTGLEVVFSAENAATIRRRADQKTSDVKSQSRSVQQADESVRLARAEEAG